MEAILCYDKSTVFLSSKKIYFFVRKICYTLLGIVINNMNLTVNGQKEELQKRLTRFEKQCRGKGLRVTQQRRKIFCTVAQSCEHPSAEKVFQAVRRELPNVSLDTVYRTLASLEEMDLLMRVGLSSKARFDGDLRPHCHFVCTRCGEVYDIFPQAGEELLSLPSAAKEMGEVKQVHLQLRGICKKCQERK